MSDEILKDLNRVIEKYKDKVFCTGELNYVDMAKSCKLEIERLNNIINECAEDILKEIQENHHLSCGVALTIRQKLIDYRELKGDGSNE